MCLSPPGTGGAEKPGVGPWLSLRPPESPFQQKGELCDPVGGPELAPCPVPHRRSQRQHPRTHACPVPGLTLGSLTVSSRGQRAGGW